MPAAMTKVQLIGRKPQLEELLGRLYELRLIQLLPADEEPALQLLPPEAEPDRLTRTSDLRLLIGQIDGLLTLAESPTENEPAAQLSPADQLQTMLREEVRELTPQVDALNTRIDALLTEAAVLPRYLEPLRRLLPLIPELSELDENALAALQLDTIVLVLNTDDDAVTETLRTGLRELLGDRFELVATRVDRDAIGCVIVLPHDSAEPVRALLGRERVRSLRLPETYERLSFRGAVAALERRLGEVPGELARARTKLHDLLAPRAPDWRAGRTGLQAALEQIEAIDQVGETGRTFVVIGWTPRRALPRLRNEL